MKALSIRPDYVFDIISGEKTIEYRSWQTDYRGDLLICATAKKIPGTIPGHALLVCRLKEVEKLPENQSSFAWHLDEFRSIDPFPVKGKLKLFDVDDNLIHFSGINDEDNPNDETIDAFLENKFYPLIV